MKANKLFRLTLLFCCAVLFCGCEMFKEAMEQPEGSEDPTSEDYTPRFVVGIFSIVRYPRASNLEKEVTSGDGRSVWINTNQNFSSKRIRAARAIPRPGDPDICDLEFRLDTMGKTQWQMLGGGRRGEPVALVIDSRYIGTFVPEISDDDDKLEWVSVRIGMDSYTARGIVKYAKKNYAHFNPKASDWFKF